MEELQRKKDIEYENKIKGQQDLVNNFNQTQRTLKQRQVEQEQQENKYWANQSWTHRNSE